VKRSLTSKIFSKRKYNGKIFLTYFVIKENQWITIFHFITLDGLKKATGVGNNQTHEMTRSLYILFNQGVYNQRPFWGIQMILSGDFFQLKPIVNIRVVLTASVREKYEFVYMPLTNIASPMNQPCSIFIWQFRDVTRFTSHSIEELCGRFRITNEDARKLPIVKYNSIFRSPSKKVTECEFDRENRLNNDRETVI